MALTRRLALALGGSTLLASCGRRRSMPASPPTPRPMEARVLDRGFPALAARARPGAFALGVMNLQTTETWFWNTEQAFPLAGAVALPLVAAALAHSNSGKLSLAERVAFSSGDLSPPPSLIDQDWPTPPDDHHGGAPAESLMTLALREADNTAIDLLMERIGGPGAVAAWLELKGVTGLRVDRYMREIDVEISDLPAFRPAWKDTAAFDTARDQAPPELRQAAMDAYIVDKRNSASVPAALGFLAMLSAGELLQRRSTLRLLSWMYGAAGGLLRSGLAPDVTFARAFGSTPTDLGFTPAVAEMGMATWPGGHTYALAAFLAGSTATAEARSALFADAARLAGGAIG